jgi:hypothetical protein
MSTTVKAHGMDGTLVEPDWAPLTLAEVRALLSQFPPCGEPIEILECEPAAVFRGQRGATRTVESSSSGIIAACAIGGIAGGASLHAHLRAWSAGAARVCKRNGRDGIEMGEWTYEVHEAPAGVDLYGDALSWTPFRTSAHARSAGRRWRDASCSAGI